MNSLVAVFGHSSRRGVIWYDVSARFDNYFELFLIVLAEIANYFDCKTHQLMIKI